MPTLFSVDRISEPAYSVKGHGPVCSGMLNMWEHIVLT